MLVASAGCRIYDAEVSTGPITKSPPAEGAALRVAGLALLAQASLRGAFLASFLLTLSRNPRLREGIVGHAYPLVWSIVLPAIFVVCGAVSGLLLLARIWVAATLATVFCILGLLFQGFAALSVAVTYPYSSHHPATHIYVRMAMNMLIYVGTLVAAVRSA